MNVNEVDISYVKKMVFEADITINSNYDVKTGDERFYRLMNNVVFTKFDKLIFPEDSVSFEEFLRSDKIDVQCFARFKTKNDKYRWILFTKKKIHSIGNEKVIDLNLKDVVAVSHVFSTYFDNMKKYRSVMNMINDKLFEYDFKSDVITFYYYRNNKSEIISKHVLSDWKDYIIKNNFVEGEDKRMFSALCANIEGGVESFTITLKSSMMSEGERTDILTFKGQTIKSGFDKTLTIGVITEQGNRMNESTIVRNDEEAKLDSATRILNKKAVSDSISSVINMAELNGDSTNMFLAIMDIDNFKSVNDLYGHYFGDEVIRIFAENINYVMGSKGIVGRIGGDEFIALLRDVNEEEARIMLKTVRYNTRTQIAELEPNYVFSTSVGVSTYKKDASDYESLFKIADAALYIAKEKGKDRYIIYDPAKHGDVMSMKNKAVLSGKDFMKPIQKFEMAAELLLDLKSGKKNIKDVLSVVIDKLNVHGITIYSGKDAKVFYSTGHYLTDCTDASYIFDKGYLNKFSEHGILAINNAAQLTVDFSNVYDIFLRNNICSSIQIVSVNEDGFKAMLQFDIFGENRRKWSEDDINVLKIIAMGIMDSLDNLSD